jgi:hypothetical protein
MKFINIFRRAKAPVGVDREVYSEKLGKYVTVTVPQGQENVIRLKLWDIEKKSGIEERKDWLKPTK